MKYLARVGLLLGFAAGCETRPLIALEDGGGSSPDDGPPATGAGGIDPGAGGAGGATSCSRNEVALELTIEGGVADSQVVPITFDGVEGYLGIDTGSPLTFVFGEKGDPEYVEYVGDAQIGCELRPMPQVTLEAIGVEEFNGKPILGILGLDFFTEYAAEIDYPGGRVVRYLREEPVTGDLASIPGEFTGDRIVLDSELDGIELRLMYDAGSHHTIWVGEDGEPGDEEVILGTADGGEVTVYEGTAELSLGTDPTRTITVWRAPEFPYIGEELAELEAAGLLGATGMGFRRILFERDAETVWLGPLSEP